jgi:hypothetical protein
VSEMIEVDEVNQDDLGRKVGYYVYAGTKMWLENKDVHRIDGPAVITPDGIERWYIRGKEITIDVRSFFAENKWKSKQGLDTPEKLAAFEKTFCK